MFFETTLVEITLLAAVKDALVVASSIIFLMDLEMLLEVGTTCELLVAVLTLEWFFTRVDSLVPNEITHLAECLVAALVVALVGLLLVVDPGVFLQGRVLGESLVTLGTIKRYG